MNYLTVIIGVAAAILIFQYLQRNEIKNAVFGNPSNKDKHQVILSEGKEFSGAKYPIEKGKSTMMYKVESYSDNESNYKISITEAYNSIKIIKPGVIMSITIKIKDIENSIKVELDEHVMDFRSFVENSSEIRNALKIPKDKNYEISITIV